MNRNYVIINGVNSLTIKGLAINLMPPITKPLMRTMREEIDGRNGDINTELGYQAYDKQIEVGLYGNYDIDEIIAFFNSKGTIVFSDENDKFYNFQILDKIDFAKMVKFRTAMINIHCQPFKYPLTDTPVDVAYEYVESAGENLTLNNTETSSLKMDLKGNTSQTQYTGKNKLKYAYPLGYSTEINGVTWTINQDGTITANGTASSLSVFTFATGTEIADLIGQSVSFNGVPPGTDTQIFMGVYNQDWSAVKNVYGGEDQTFTIPSTATRVLARVYTGLTANHITFKPMIRLSSVSDSTYEPYVGGVPSPNPQFPQPVNVVSGDNVLSICGKNLFDKSKEINSTYTSSISTALNNYLSTGEYATGYTSGASTLSNNANYVSTFTPCVSGTTYTIYNTYSFAANLSSVCFLDTNGNIINKSSGWSNSAYTHTATSEEKYIMVGINTNDNGVDYRNYVQIEVGSTATTYEPYIGNSYPIYLGVKNLIDSDANTENTLSNYGNVNITLNSACTLPAGTYTLSFDAKSDADSGRHLNKVNFYNVSTLVKQVNYYKELTSNWQKMNVSLTFDSETTFTTIPIQVVEGGVYYFKNFEMVEGNKYNHTSTTPIELCKIGDYQDSIKKSTGKNLFDASVIQGGTKQGITLSLDGQNIHIEATSPTGNANFYMTTGSSISLDAGTYYLTRSSLSGVATLKLNSGATTIVSTGNSNVSFTLDEPTIIDGLTLQVPSSVGAVNIDVHIQLEKGTQATEWQPFGVGKWYLYKTIEKIILNGSETGWTSYKDSINIWNYYKNYTNVKKNMTNLYCYCDYFKFYTIAGNTPKGQFQIGGQPTSKNGNIIFNPNDDTTNEIEAFKTWLGTHNIMVYYPLENPTATEITEEQLVEQLNAIQNAVSYSGQTNITQKNSDKPFMIDATALKKGSDTAVLNNIGNIYSKPVIALKGTGIVNIYNDGVQAFQVDMSKENDIIIDTEMMEAYTPTKLANRQVTGDYSKFMIDTGSHDVKFDGELTEATITRYVRWL